MTRAFLGCVACLAAVACSGPDARPAAAGTSGASGSSGAAQTGGMGATAPEPDAGNTGGAGGAGALPGAGGSLGSGTWGPEACPAAPGGVGYSVGDSLGELTVVDCDTGEPRSLDELCGASATWIFTAHSHCPTCKATAGFTPSVAKQVAEKNVAIAHIMYDDNGTTCAAWKLT